MFRGSSTVSVDDKGRVAVPARFRDQLLADENGLILTVNPWDPSLLLYPFEDWRAIEEKLATLADYDKQSRRTKQIIRGYANECRIDKQGRILVSADLRDFAKFSKQAVILGQGNKLEIWSQELWAGERDAWLADTGEESSSSASGLTSLSL
ncbi:MAG: division/cell wall cluster transcriptional repressor MraZ [Pseudomonadota bacterium]